MKKVYLLGLLAFVTSSASFAQRTIDWQVVEILKPTEILSNVTTGTQIVLKAVLKNNGPSLAEIGDTLVYQISLFTETDQLLIALPNGAYYYKRLFADVKSGDTMHLDQTYTIPYYFNNSMNVKLRLVSYVWFIDPLNPLSRETSTTSTNNVLTKNMIWWNPNHFGVGIEDFKTNQLLSVYPNPASSSVNISWNVMNVGSTETVISVRDLQGRLVLERVVSPLSSFETLDVSSICKGLYLVEIKNGDFKTTQKLQITN